jgi:hypothetical protein
MTDDDGVRGRQSLVHLAAQLAFVSTMLARAGARRAADDLRALRTQILGLVDTSREDPREAPRTRHRLDETK